MKDSVAGAWVVILTLELRQVRRLDSEEPRRFTDRGLGCLHAVEDGSGEPPAVSDRRCQVVVASGPSRLLRRPGLFLTVVEVEELLAADGLMLPELSCDHHGRDVELAGNLAGPVLERRAALPPPFGQRRPREEQLAGNFVAECLDVARSLAADVAADREPTDKSDRFLVTLDPVVAVPVLLERRTSEMTSRRSGGSSRNRYPNGMRSCLASFWAWRNVGTASPVSHCSMVDSAFFKDLARPDLLTEERARAHRSITGFTCASAMTTQRYSGGVIVIWAWSLTGERQRAAPRSLALTLPDEQWCPRPLNHRAWATIASAHAPEHQEFVTESAFGPIAG